MAEARLLKNISRLATMLPGRGRDGLLGVIENAAVRIRDDKIVWVGKQEDLPEVSSREDVIDCRGLTVMPGLVDCHTHIVHAGYRQNEFDLRSKGATYQDIAKDGGGIMSTVKATRAASLDELVQLASARIAEAVSYGTTTFEIKTGYGLDLENEMKIAQAIGRLKSSEQVTITGTFLGAHVVPAEFRDNRGGYVKLILDEMLPKIVSMGSVNACDVFVEEGAFTCDEARMICNKARELGLQIHLHVDQFSDVNGGVLAAELGALSADHLDYISDDGIVAMIEKNIFSVLLPGASFFTGKGHYPNARKMIEMGSNIVIASDYNPGTCPCLNLWLVATIAVTQMGISCDEALLGVTRRAAKALGFSDRGMIEAGARADIVVLDSPDEHFPLYKFGVRCVKKTIAAGRVIYERGN